MASFVILLIARTARIACVDRHTHETTTVTLSAHARRGLINVTLAAHARRGLIKLISIDVHY